MQIKLLMAPSLALRQSEERGELLCLPGWGTQGGVGSSSIGAAPPLGSCHYGAGGESSKHSPRMRWGLQTACAGGGAGELGTCHTTQAQAPPGDWGDPSHC